MPRPDDADAVAFLQVLLTIRSTHVGEDGLGLLLREVLAFRDIRGEMLEGDGGGARLPSLPCLASSIVQWQESREKPEKASGIP